MESIAQIASNASKLVFGESSNTEPLSGTQGDVSKGEPYDAGNLEAGEQQRVEHVLTGTVDSSDPAYSTGSKGSDGAYTSSSKANSSGGNDIPTSHNPGNTITTATNRTSNSDFTSSGGDIRGGASNSSKQDLRSNTQRTSPSVQDLNPNTRTSSKGDGGAPVSQRSNVGGDDEPEVDVSGAGPRDLAAVARERGGNAGGTSSTDKSSSSDGRDVDGSNGGQDKGTGELYVKSTGLQADGGDFDATKPGAGREADRLLEEKGMSGSGTAKASGNSDGSDHKPHASDGSGKEKHGLVEKIKEKLHKH